VLEILQCYISLNNYNRHTASFNFAGYPPAASTQTMHSKEIKIWQKQFNEMDQNRRTDVNKSQALMDKIKKGECL